MQLQVESSESDGTGSEMGSNLNGSRKKGKRRKNRPSGKCKIIISLFSRIGANVTKAEGELHLNAQLHTRSISSSEEYHTSQRDHSIRKRRLKQRDQSTGLHLPPELRSSSRLASKSAVYQFSETSSEDSESHPTYSYVEQSHDSPAIDIVLTHRRKDVNSKQRLYLNGRS